MTVYLAVLLMCHLPENKNVKCELIGDTEIYTTLEQCTRETSKVNTKFRCLQVEVKQ